MSMQLQLGVDALQTEDIMTSYCDNYERYSRRCISLTLIREEKVTSRAN